MILLHRTISVARKHRRLLLSQIGRASICYRGTKVVYLAEAATTYGLVRFEIWRRLYLPAVFPHLVTGLITAAGGSWNASIVAEYVRYRGQTLIAPGLG